MIERFGFLKSKRCASLWVRNQRLLWVRGETPLSVLRFGCASPVEFWDDRKI